MKTAELSYHRDFPDTPVSVWAGARRYGWVNEPNGNGQWRRPKREIHPFPYQRKLWCLLKVHFQGVDLVFAMPAELNQFIEVLSQNPMPSGQSLVKGHKLGRPKRHWLSRLPKEAKPWNFRQKLCKFLQTAPAVLEFREFYASQPVKLEFDGYFGTHFAALKAQGRIL